MLSSAPPTDRAAPRRAALHRKHQDLTGQVRETTRDAHAELLQALQDRQPEPARRPMHRHIQGWYEWLPTLEVAP